MADERKDSQGDAIDVLLLEDDRDDQALLTEALNEVQIYGDQGQARLDVKVVESLKQGREALAAGRVDVILADLNLPDSKGMDTVAALRACAPNVPVVVLTGNHEQASIDAIRLGAQEFLLKGEMSGEFISYALRAAVARHQMMMRQRQALLDQIQRLGRETPDPDVSKTMAEESAPDYQCLLREYRTMLDRAFEGRLYRDNTELTSQLQALAKKLAACRASARDVVRMHSLALEEITRTIEPIKAKAYLQEGHLAVLELMGYLADHYRRALASPEATNAPPEN